MSDNAVQPRRVALDVRREMVLVGRDGQHYYGRVLGSYTVRKATPQEQAQFAPLREALTEQTRRCWESFWATEDQAAAEQAGDAAQRGPVHQGRLSASVARDGRNRAGTRE